MKNKLFLSVCVLAALPVAISSCSNKGPEIDKTKTQLYVYNWDGGYGSTWIESAIKEYEKTVANESFEEGKTGVQIILSKDKNNSETSSIASFDSGNTDVFFTENLNYYAFTHDVAGNRFLDLTDVMTTPNKYDNKKIINKISAQYQDYLKCDGDKFYGIPHYSGFYGITYSIEIFDSLNAYLDANGKIIAITGQPKGLGPNGKTGTIDGIDYSYDDGLPATYDEFFTLCSYIKGMGKWPIHWTGKYLDQHLSGLFRSLASDCDGFDVTRMKSTFSGTYTGVKVDTDYSPLFDEQDRLITEQITVKDEKGQRNGIYRTQGAYYAADFIKRLTQVPVTEDATKGTYSHLDAQTHYVYSNTALATQDKQGNKVEYAMLVDGPWWESEARDAFQDCVDQFGDQKYSRANRKFGWLPLPKPNASFVGKGNTILDHLESFVVARNTTDASKAKLIKDFIAFMNSDAQLLNFTKDTGVKKNMDYPIPEADLNGLSSYAQSLIKYELDTQIVYPGSTNAYYRENFSNFTYSAYYKCPVRGNNYGPGQAFITYPTLTAAEWFKSYASYKKGE